MKIKIPDNYTLPEDIADGDTFEELVTFRVEGDSLVPTMIAGTEISSDESGSESETEVEVNVGGEGEGEGGGEMGASPMKGMGKRIMGMA